MKALSRMTAMVLLAISIPAFAHGNMDHILGKVKSIDGNKITVEKDGTSTEVVLTKTTTWEINGKPGQQINLNIGDRVVIHALKLNGIETAREVRLVHPTAAN